MSPSTEPGYCRPMNTVSRIYITLPRNGQNGRISLRRIAGLYLLQLNSTFYKRERIKLWRSTKLARQARSLRRVKTRNGLPGVPAAVGFHPKNPSEFGFRIITGRCYPCNSGNNQQKALTRCPFLFTNCLCFGLVERC